MATRSHDTQRPWSSDLVEHLRLVHFSLVALCVGLLVIATSRHDTVAMRAERQLDQITAVVQRLDVDGSTHTVENERRIG